jgi:Flp pilus assembly protein TadG
MRKHSLRDFCKGSGGATAIEFAIVAPLFLAMVVGGLYACLMMFSMGSLQDAAQDAARCWSVKTTVCTDSSSTQTYAASHYYGPAVSPSFTASILSCGHNVTGTISYSFPFYYQTLTVPLTATSCFP